jgi:hypothetical protein
MSTATRSRPANEEPQEKTTANRPVFSKKVPTGSGKIEVSVWQNTKGEGDKERLVLSITLKKTYKSDGEYKESTSLFPQDLEFAIQALTAADEFCADETAKK